MNSFRKASVAEFLDRARSMNPKVFDRLMVAIKKNADTQCWELQRYISVGGYGAIRVDGIKQRAHRWLYQALFGNIGDLEVLHVCHNPGCVFPGHLRAGTHKQNMDDRERAGRGGDHRGVANGRSKLTDAQVRIIRSSNQSGAALGRLFGVSKETACAIKRGAKWSHVQ